MDDLKSLIPVSYDNPERPTVSGRELHDFLQVKTAYKDWFPRMVEYGFTEGEDFCSILSESTGGRPSTDHQLTIPMAKELCMIQRNEPEEKHEYKTTYIPNYNMAPAAKPSRPKYTGPSVAEIDAEAKKLGVSYGKYVLMLQQGRI